MAQFLVSFSVSVIVWSKDGVGFEECFVGSSVALSSFNLLHVLFAPDRHQPLYP